MFGGRGLLRKTKNHLNGIFESKFIYQVDKKMASSCGCGISFTPKNV